jgi:hypothetical protein
MNYFDYQNPPPSRDTQADLDRIPDHFAKLAALHERAMKRATPGPWLLEKSIGENELDCGWYINPKPVDYNYRGSICYIADAEHIGGITVAERDSNARLIVKAPDMRSLLRHCAEVLAACDAHVDIGDGEGSYSTVALAAQIDTLIAEIDE